MVVCDASYGLQVVVQRMVRRGVHVCACVVRHYVGRRSYREWYAGMCMSVCVRLCMGGCV